MSRSGYEEDWDGGCYPPEFYRQAVDKATNGKRGQAFLRRLLRVLDNMPVKALASHEWVKGDQACALGLVAKSCGYGAMFEAMDPDDDNNPEVAARLLNIAPAMAREIVYMNDEGARAEETPEQRWARMRKWVSEQVKEKAA